MNSNEITVSQQEIDWLVDGELDKHEREQLLSRLDRDTDGWRRCALTFIETRLLADNIRDLGLSLSANELAQSDSGSVQIELSRTPFNQRHGRRSSPALPPQKPAPRERSSSAVKWIGPALAGCLLLGIGFGFGALQNGKVVRHVAHRTNADRQYPAPVANQLATAQYQQTIREISRAVRTIGIPDARVVALAGIQEGQQTFILPVIESESLQIQILESPRPELPSGLSLQLREQGWLINQQRNIVSLDLPNGRRQVVPIDMLNYQFVGRETF